MARSPLSLIRAALGAGSLALGALALASWRGEPCDEAEYPDPRGSPYDLPYPAGEARPVRQGNCDEGNTHNRRYNASFAYDFAMPLGSSVAAARDGVVIRASDGYSDDDHDPEHGNLAIVRHRDGTYALYGHLQRGSLQVAVGDRVRRGQALARSGDSGLSRGPHLHFAVIGCPLAIGDHRLFCRTLPTTFRP